MTATWPPKEREHPVAARAEALMYLSLALLLLSTIRDGPVGDAVTLLWLGSLAVLAFLNAGAAFGLYIAAVALYGILHFSGWGSIFERPDNYALPLVLGGLGWRTLTRRPGRLWNRSTIVIGTFLAYGLLQGVWLGIMDRLTFAWYMRMFGLPLLMFLLLGRYRLRAPRAAGAGALPLRAGRVHGDRLDRGAAGMARSHPADVARRSPPRRLHARAPGAPAGW